MNEIIKTISKESKKTILKALKSKAELKSPYKQSKDPVVHIKTSKQGALDQMIQKMSDNKFIVQLCEKDELEARINEISSSYGYEKLIYGQGLRLDIDKIKASEKICFDRPIEELRTEVFHSDFSIIHAEYGISSHGVVCVKSSKEQPRMLSLAPILCIILLEKEKVLDSLAQALNLIKAEDEFLPNNILFIAGPSRTADIELITVFGVHGSQKVHLLIY